MTNTPSLAQLLKHAINNQLLEVHTAIIGRIERYDASKQQADIQPILKQALKTIDAEIKEEELPLLPDVPVLFPRAGGFFLSLPIKRGDYVQVIFNEVSLDNWLTNTSSSISSNERFGLQGAVAIPGIFPEAQALLGAHKENLVLGHDQGVQIHIDGEKIRLGSADANKALAIASKVKEELEKFRSAFNSHVHTQNNVFPSKSLITLPLNQGLIGSLGNIASPKGGRRMMDLKLHEGDLKIINGDLSLCVNNTETIAQAIKIRLRTLKGEWFLDTQAGIPYLSEVFGQKRSEPFLRHLIVTEIEKVEGIKAINNFNIQLDENRVAHITFIVVLSDQSTIQFKEEIGV